jgi:beta-galactosidase
MAIQYLDRGWDFVSEWSEDFKEGKQAGLQVDLPHTVKEIPFNYFDEKETMLLTGYRKTFKADPAWQGQRVFLVFEGAAQEATVFFNGKELGTHRCGYTSFRFEITDLLQADNAIAVRLDSRESLNQPPFGYVIDYLCYGGLYRDVYLEIENPTFIKDAYFADADLQHLHVSYQIEGEIKPSLSLVLSLKDKEGQEVKNSGSLKPENAGSFTFDVTGLRPWSAEEPNLYEAALSLKDGEEVLSSFKRRIGIRTARFQADGFYLNGKKLRLRGLNRHQAYPYIGYAATDSLQRADARILKYELGLNTVRTSHYPDSQAFLDECDRIGLLVFTEIPGWQHIGDEEWKKQAEQNVLDMIADDKNHPSIFLWGVRINESQDDDPFYLITNRLAHEADPYRQTSGVRYLTKSHLLEDVYAHNDFIFTGTGRALKKKSQATPDMKKGYFISECNGHMYPTKSFDDEPHRFEHAMRHVQVLEAMYASKDIGGLIGWCAFDYNTHGDFGSGDKICYHGVGDMFRNLKEAGYVYASQQEQTPVLEISSSMNKGEYPASSLKDIVAFTNADSVKLYKNGEFVKEFFPDRRKYPGLPHPPIAIDDLVGDLLRQHEKYKPKVAKRIAACLMGFVRYGSKLPLSIVLKVVDLMAFHGLRLPEAYGLYNKYFGGWGGKAPVFTFEAIKDGKTVKRQTETVSYQTKLELWADHTDLSEGKTYDQALVRIKAVDENGNVLPYLAGGVHLERDGPIEIIGPQDISLPGGMFGTLIRTAGREGKARLIISSAQSGRAEIEFNIRKEK